jgi:hypothetical protein
VLRDQQQQNGLVLEPVTLEDILALSALPALHRDPFDRLIIAQANQGGLHLITHDPELPAIQWRCFGKWHRLLHALERWESALAHFRIFHPSRLYGIHPSGVARYRLASLKLLDNQAITYQPQCRFESVIASD